MNGPATLRPEHVAQLAASAISETFALENRVESVPNGLRFNYFNGRGDIYNVRLDRPSDPKRKYLRPKGVEVCLYLPPATLEWLQKDPTAPLVIVEGEKKALSVLEHGFPAAAVQGTGCWSKGRTDEEKKAKARRYLLDDIAVLPLDRRPVMVLFDADPKPSTQRDTRQQAFAFALALERERDAIATIGQLALSPTGAKMGVDDWLAALTVDERGPFLQSLLDRSLPPCYYSVAGDRRIISVRELVATTEKREPMIEGLLPEHTLSMFAGPRKIGKSAVVQHVAIGIATGGIVFGKLQVNRPRPVLLIDVDQGRHNAADRWRRAIDHMVGDSPDVIERWHLPQFLLASPEDVAAVASWARYVERRSGAGPFIAIDTFRAAIPFDVSENDSSVAVLLNNLRPIVDDTRASILVVHHTNQAGQIRGSTGIGAAVDDIWLARKLEDHFFALNFDEIRTGPSPAEIAVKVSHEDYGCSVASPDERETEDTRAAVLRVLVSEPRTCKSIAAEIGRSESRVFRVLADLEAQGRARKVNRRGYASAEPPACAPACAETDGASSDRKSWTDV